MNLNIGVNNNTKKYKYGMLCLNIQEAIVDKMWGAVRLISPFSTFDYDTGKVVIDKKHALKQTVIWKLLKLKVS